VTDETPGESPDRSPQAPAELMEELEEAAGTDPSIQKVLDRLVERLVDVLPVTGAGVMLVDERQRLHFVAASDDTMMAIEELQNTLDEGPCLEAHATGEAVAINDVEHDQRFPLFSPRASAEGLGAIFVFPLALDGDRLGALDVYRDTPGPLNDEDLQTAQVLADVAAAYLVNAQARIDASETVARLSHLHLHDPLTGLPNRTLFEERLEQAIARARRSHLVAAVLFADLDGFKEVNDHYGHEVGDELLCAAATRLASALRPGDTVARLGGDEFVVICEDLHEEAEAERVAERLTTALATPFELSGGQRVALTASLGLAFSGPERDTTRALLRDADFAMYQAKHRGGGHHQVLNVAARSAADRRERLERDLRHAQDRDELALAYQPIVDLRSGELAAVEALLRWDHPDRGRVMPDVVIPSAERTGLIRSVGEWSLRQACLDLRRWSALGLTVPQVAVNVSALQVADPTFARTVERVLADTGADPGSVCIEVTERAFLVDTPRVHAVLEEVQSFGVRLSLDDFGTGYSSLNYLRQFPFHAVKIDHSFTSALSTDQVTRSVVRAMIDLGHVLGLTVTVEGVETPLHLEEVSALGADHAQGFHVGHPVAAEQLAAGLPGPAVLLSAPETG
jgi:diguanylate cyclase (GGDEF)-like protein